MFKNYLGIDLGTANTLVFCKGEGIILNEPSVVAIDTSDKKVLAVGSEAKQMIGRTPGNITAIRPLRDGVIADFGTTSTMLRYFIKKACSVRKFWRKPSVVVCVPSGVTAVERRAIEESILTAGVSSGNVALIEEPIAAAIGAGMPISEPTGSMIVDIGGGTTEIAVISLCGIVTSKSLHVAGDEIDHQIIAYVRREFGLAIGDRTAEDIKMTVGCAFEPDPSVTMTLRGRDLVSGLPRTITLSEVEGKKAMDEGIEKIIDAIRLTLEKTPPELSSDIMEGGIVLAGGGSLIHGMDRRVSHETGIDVRVANDPLYCVAIGTGMVLEYDELRQVLSSYGKRKRR